MVWNLPILLTWLRILAIPMIIVATVMGKHNPAGPGDAAAGLLFAAAAITDTLDGYLARRLGQTTSLGAFLDPVADKLIVAVALVLIVSRDTRLVMVLTAVVIIGREIAVSAQSSCICPAPTPPPWCDGQVPPSIRAARTPRSRGR